MKAVDLLSVAIIANWWLNEALETKRINKESFSNEIEAVKELRKIAAKFADDEEILIDKMPF